MANWAKFFVALQSFNLTYVRFPLKKEGICLKSCHICLHRSKIWLSRSLKMLNSQCRYFLANCEARYPKYEFNYHSR